MPDVQLTTVDPSSTPVPRRRAATALGALLALAVVGAAVVGCSAAQTPTAAGPTLQTPGPDPQDPSTTVLTVPVAGGAPAMCAALTAEALRADDLAFAGRVTQVADGRATLTVSEVFTGRATTTVEVPQGDAGAVVDGAAPVFQVGETWLVAASDGAVSSCGVTAADSPELRAVYTAAFPG